MAGSAVPAEAARGSCRVLGKDHQAAADTGQWHNAHRIADWTTQRAQRLRANAAVEPQRRFTHSTIDTVGCVRIGSVRPSTSARPPARLACVCARICTSRSLPQGGFGIAEQIQRLNKLTPASAGLSLSSADRQQGARPGCEWDRMISASEAAEVAIAPSNPKQRVPAPARPAKRAPE